MSCDNARLEPLVIISYHTEDRGDGSPVFTEVDQFETQFDPESYTRRFQNVYEGQGSVGINVSLPSTRYSHSRAAELSFQLIVDASNAGGGLLDLIGGALGGGDDESEGVVAQIDHFLEVCYDYDGEIHQPRFLRVEWGNMSEPCRLQSVDIEYTMFSRESVPIRAQLNTTFLRDVSEELRVRQEDRQSPDLAKQHVITDGDTLPLISQKSYGSSAYFLALAKYNGLDHFRNLTPGVALKVPSLDQLLKAIDS